MLRIGPLAFSLPAVQAALSGYSDRPMRVVARSRGADLTMAEVVLDKLVVMSAKYRARALEIGEDDHPIGGQLMGAEPGDFGRAAGELVACRQVPSDYHLRVRPEAPAQQHRRLGRRGPPRPAHGDDARRPGTRAARGPGLGAGPSGGCLS